MSDGSVKEANVKPSNKHTITVKFKQIISHSGGILALDEKGFLWMSKGSLEDAVWEKVRHPKMDVDIDESRGDQRRGPSRPGAARFSQPLTQKLPLNNTKV